MSMRLVSLICAAIIGTGYLTAVSPRRNLPPDEATAFQVLRAQMAAHPKQGSYSVRYRCNLISTGSLSYDGKLLRRERNSVLGQHTRTVALPTNLLAQEMATGKF